MVELWSFQISTEIEPTLTHIFWEKRVVLRTERGERHGPCHRGREETHHLSEHPRGRRWRDDARLGIVGQGLRPQPGANGYARAVSWHCVGQVGGVEEGHARTLTTRQRNHVLLAEGIRHVPIESSGVETCGQRFTIGSFCWVRLYRKHIERFGSCLLHVMDRWCALTKNGFTRTRF